MSFQVDPFLLLALGFLTGKLGTLAVAMGGRLMDRAWWTRSFRIVGGLTVALFWLFAALFYVDAIRIFGLSGPDFMWNWPVPLGVVRSASSDAAAYVVLLLVYPLSFYGGFQAGWLGSRLLRGRASAVTEEVLDELIAGSIPFAAGRARGARKAAADRVRAYLRSVPPTFRASVQFLVAASVGFLAPRLVPGRRPFLRAWTDDDLMRYYRELTETENPAQRNLAIVFKTVAAVGVFTDSPGWDEVGYPGPPPTDRVPWHTPVASAPVPLQEALDELRRATA